MKWEKVKLGDAATFVNGYPFKPTDWKSVGKEIIRIQNLTGSTKEANYFDGRIPEKYLVRKGDILISWSGTLGVYEWNRGDGWLNQHIFRVVFDKLDFDKSFFRHLISSKISEMQRQVHGATMQHITKGKFDNLLIPLPPLPVQRAIADRLDRADALRQKDRQLLQAYDDLAQSVFVEMFGDPVKNEKGWEVKKLKDVVKNHDNQRIPVKESDRQKLHGEYPYYGATGIIDYVNQFIYAGKFLLIAEDGKNLLFRKRKNAFIAEGKFWVNNHAHVLSFDGKAELEFLEFYLNQIDLKPYVTGIDQFKLTRTDLDRIAVLLPPLSLQTRFATILANIERQKDLVRRQQAESEALFGRLLQEAFEG